MTKLIECELPEITVNPGPSQNLPISTRRVSPAGIFYPTFIVVPEDAAEHLLVHDLKVGKNSQVGNNLSFPATVFTKKNTLMLDGIPPGMCMSFHVACTGTKPVQFRGAVFGTRSKPTNPRRLLLGLGLTTVRAGETVVIPVVSQVCLKLTHLHVPHSVLEHFEVLSIESERYLDTESRSSASPDCLTKERLLEEGAIDLFPEPRIQVSSTVEIKVRNLDQSRASEFTGALLGTSIE